MKTWKVLGNGLSSIVAYVQILESCTIYDTAYAALQLVRSQFLDNKGINGTQILNEQKEQIQEGIPVFTLE